MTKPVREFSANVGDFSTGLAGPDTIEKDLDKALKMFDPLALLPDGVNYGGISGENIKQVTTAASLPTTGLSIPDIRLVKDPAGDGSVPPALYVWDGTTWRSFNAVVDYAAKFDASTGHKHTGVAGDGPVLPAFDAVSGHKHTGVAGDGPQILPDTTPKLPLVIPTYDSDPSITHPAVVFVPNGFNGYRYWMVFTPWPISSRENPSIVASQNGIDWEVPAGLVNPIFSQAQAQALGYDFNSDPHIVLLPNNKLAVYWRTAGGVNVESIQRLESSDGITWNNRTQIMQNPAEPYKFLSPTIEIGSDGKYYLWCVEMGTDIRVLVRYDSVDGLTFANRQVCTIPARSNPWHLDVKRIGSNWYALITDSYQLLFWSSNDGLTWTGSPRPCIDVPPDGGNFFYRSAFLPRTSSPLQFDLWLASAQTNGVTVPPWSICYYEKATLPIQKVNQERDLMLTRAGLGMNPFIVADLFNRPDNTGSLGNASTGQAWTVLSGILGVADKAAYKTGVAVIDANYADCYIEAELDSANNLPQEMWINFRVTDANNRWRFGYLFSATGIATLQLQKIEGGVVTGFGSAGEAYPGDIIGVRLEGTNIKMYRNWRLVAERNDLSFNQLATSHGFQLASDSARLRNFIVSRLT